MSKNKINGKFPDEKANRNTSRGNGKNGKQNRSGSRNYRGQKKDECRDGNYIVGAAKPNNPSWYYPNTQLLNAAASLPFSNLQGLSVDLWTENLTSLNEMPFPGIAQLNYVPSLGCTKAAVDGPTMAARYIYSFVRHANSGSRNYEAPDLYMYIMAWCSAASVIEEMKRVYGTMRAFIPKNRFYPAAMVTAMGGDFNNLSGNLPAFRALINLNVARLNALKIPAGLPILERWKQLATTYYMDGKTTKCQLYVPKMLYALKWEQTAMETGSALSYYDFEDDPCYYSIEACQQILDDLLGSMIENEDLGIMSGDILKAYGEGNCASLSMIDDDYICLPVESDEMLYQIHNAEFVGTPTFTDYIHAWQTPEGVIQSETTFLDNGTSINGIYNLPWRKGCLDFYKADPTPEDVIVATRWMYAGRAPSEKEGAPETLYTVTDTGSDIMCYCRIISDPNAGGLYTDPIVTSNTIYRGDVTGALLNSQACAKLTLSAFDFAPIMWLVCNSNASGNMFDSRTVPMTNIENYTFIDRDIIARMNHVVMLNMLGNSVYTPFK